MAKDADIPPTSPSTGPHTKPGTPAASPPRPRPQLFDFSSSTTTQPQPQYTFTQIIDADHFTIQALAKRIRSLLSPPATTSTSTLLTTLKPPLLHLTWRLIHHDLSEDLVMRPAFTHALGAEGHHMSTHDRQDHARARRALLHILSALERMPAPEDARQKLQYISDLVMRTFDDLAAHMTVESGQFLPHFESIIPAETSRRLAREYASTLVLSPDVTVTLGSGAHGRRGSADAVADTDTDAGGDGSEQRVPLFPGGIMEYVNSDPGRLRECYEMVMRDAENDGGQYLTDMVQREVERLQVGKWLSLNERKALRESGPSTAGYDMGKL